MGKTIKIPEKPVEKNKFSIGPPVKTNIQLKTIHKISLSPTPPLDFLWMKKKRKKNLTHPKLYYVLCFMFLCFILLFTWFWFLKIKFKQISSNFKFYLTWVALDSCEVKSEKSVPPKHANKLTKKIKKH